LEWLGCNLLLLINGLYRRSSTRARLPILCHCCICCLWLRFNLRQFCKVYEWHGHQIKIVYTFVVTHLVTLVVVVYGWSFAARHVRRVESCITRIGVLRNALLSANFRSLVGGTLVVLWVLKSGTSLQPRRPQAFVSRLFHAFNVRNRRLQWRVAHMVIILECINIAGHPLFRLR